MSPLLKDGRHHCDCMPSESSWELWSGGLNRVMIGLPSLRCRGLLKLFEWDWEVFSPNLILNSWELLIMVILDFKLFRSRGFKEGHWCLRDLAVGEPMILLLIQCCVRDHGGIVIWGRIEQVIMIQFEWMDDLMIVFQQGEGIGFIRYLSLELWVS